MINILLDRYGNEWCLRELDFAVIILSKYNVKVHELLYGTSHSMLYGVSNEK